MQQSMITLLIDMKTCDMAALFLVYAYALLVVGCKSSYGSFCRMGGLGLSWGSC